MMKHEGKTNPTMDVSCEQITLQRRKRKRRLHHFCHGEMQHQTLARKQMKWCGRTDESVNMCGLNCEMMERIYILHGFNFNKSSYAPIYWLYIRLVVLRLICDTTAVLTHSGAVGSCHPCHMLVQGFVLKNSYN